MHWLAPIFAQVVTLSAGDRVEGRYVASKVERYFETSNGASANADLTWNWKRTSLSIGYSPTLDIVPLLDTPRDVILNHNAHVTGSYRWRVTTLSVGVSASYGDRDLRRELIAPHSSGTTAPTPQQPEPGQGTPGQTPPGQAPPTGGATGGTTQQGAQATTPAVLDIARLGSLRFGANLGHELSRDVSLGVSGGYSLSGGVDDRSRAVYPVLPSVDAGVFVSFEADGRNTFTTGFTNQVAWAADETRTYLAVLSESWLHLFSRHTTGNVGAGVAYSRTDVPNFPTLHQIYPTGAAGIGYTDRLARGTLTLGANVMSAPVLDLTTAVIDPRLGVGANAGWSRDRFSMAANIGSAVSLSPGGEGALSSVSAEAKVKYDIGAGFYADAGIRETWQRFAGVTLVDPTTVYFGGVGWGDGVELNRHRKH